MDLRKTSLVGLVAAFAAQGLAAQEVAQTQDDELSEPIVVTGHRQSEINGIRFGVDRILPSDAPTDPIARFIDPVCLGFAGLNARQQATFREMIEFRGKNAGVRFARPKCRVNALVVIVDDPATFVSEAKSKQSKFMPLGEHRKFDNALKRGDPVYAWTSQEIRTALGRPAPHSATIPGLTLPMAVATKVNTDARGRRVGLEQSAGLVRAIVIFDAKKITGLTLVQLADYAAMRLLAPSEVNARWQGDHPKSILKLFSLEASEIEASMTVFDESYLAAIYGLPLNASPSRLKPTVVSGYLERREVER